MPGFLTERRKAADSGVIHYSVYEMSRKEKVLYVLLAAIILFAVGMVFYRSVTFSALLTPLAFFYPKIRTREIIEARRNELALQFKDMLYSLSSSLYAGKSVESAFRDALKDLSILYPDPDTYIIHEVQSINGKIAMNATVESALADFALRACLEDVDNFTDVFHTCKRTGGNLVEVIRNTSNIINDKIEIRQEIDTMLAERRFERKVLNVLPIAMILLLSFSAADYINPVFETAAGRAVMTVAMALLAVAYFVSRKIMDIRV